MNDKDFLNSINKIIDNRLNAHGLLIQPWHHGKVSRILSPTSLKVFVDASDVEQTIKCSKNEPYVVGDEVWVVYINNNPRDKFVFGLRGVST